MKHLQLSSFGRIVALCLGATLATACAASRPLPAAAPEESMLTAAEMAPPEDGLHMAEAKAPEKARERAPEESASLRPTRATPTKGGALITIATKR
jgi:hypothetical protein